MNHNPYLLNVNQTNGCRNWQNPLTNVKYEIPEKPTELFIKNLPKEMLEIDLLPHFERFGPIYQFRLLIDYDNCNRGFAYLIYFYQKSALRKITEEARGSSDNLILFHRMSRLDGLLHDQARNNAGCRVVSGTIAFAGFKHPDNAHK